MVLYSLISCRDTFSETGDLLKDINYNAHTMGDQRYLYQETTSADTIAEYKYAGKQLIQIKGIDRMTYMSYSGDQVNQIRILLVEVGVDGPRKGWKIGFKNILRLIILSPHYTCKEFITLPGIL